MSPFPFRTPHRILAGLAVSACCLLGAPIPAMAASPGRVVLPSPLPKEVFGTPGPADPGFALHLRVYLAGQDPAGRVGTAAAVSTPGNPAYAHFLSPQQFTERFGAGNARSDRARAWLTGSGMKVTAANAHYLSVDATVGEANAAFDTDISFWKDFGLVTVAPVGDVSVPAQVADDIATVLGLTDQFFEDPGTTRTPAAAARTLSAPPTTTTPPCSHFWAEHTASIPPAYGHTNAPTALCGYTPQQMRTAYGVTGSAYTGKGATVAVLLDGASPTMQPDANAFFAAHGLPGFVAGQYREDIVPGSLDHCADQGLSGVDLPEEATDVETVHIIAPDAQVVYVSTGCGDEPIDFLDATTRVVDRHLADVMTDSFGTREDGISPAEATAWELILQQGAVEGIGFDCASGDHADNSGGTPGEDTPTYPCSDPWVTSVGGTSLALDRAGHRLFEVGWGDNQAPISDGAYLTPPPGDFDLGSGGGPSRLFARPAYQNGFTSSPYRVSPDVSADAGLFWLIGYTGASLDQSTGGPFAEVPFGGGTSGSSPILAALQANAKQAGGHALGFVNPALYRLAGTPALTDVRPVNPADPPVFTGDPFGRGPGLTTMGEDSTLTVRPGYDEVTGLGTPTSRFVMSFP